MFELWEWFHQSLTSRKSWSEKNGKKTEEKQVNCVVYLLQHFKRTVMRFLTGRMAANKERGGKFTSSRDGTCQTAIILVRKSGANIFTNKNDRK